MRVTHHLAVLVLLGAMTLSGVGARWGEQPCLVGVGGAVAVPDVERQRRQHRLVAGEPSSVGADSSSTLAVDRAPSPDAAAGRRRRRSRPSRPASGSRTSARPSCSTGPDAEAASLGHGCASSAPSSWSSRSRTAARACSIRAAARDGCRPPSGRTSTTSGRPVPPKYEYELAKGGDVDAIDGQARPERIDAGLAAAPDRRERRRSRRRVRRACSTPRARTPGWRRPAPPRS